MLEGKELHETAISHIEWCYRNRQSSFIGAYCSPEGVTKLINGVIDLVARLDNWPAPINYTYGNFQIANQSLYLHSGITIDVMQRPHAYQGTGWQFADVDVSKYTKFYFDFGPSTEVEDHY